MMNIRQQHKTFAGQVNFYQHTSDITACDMRFSMFVPNSAPQGALLWLSGLTCTEENFITKGGALKWLSDNNWLLLCPDTSPRNLTLPNEHQDWDFGSGASFYVDALTAEYAEHYLMRSYIINELYPWLEREFNMQGKICLSGHSMGGHGALTLGLTYPEKFASVSAFAPIVNPINCPWGKKAFSGYLGTDEALWQAYDACALLASGHRHPNSLLIYQGSADQFLEQQLLTQNFVKIAEQHQQPFALKWCDGYDHSHFFIHSFIETHLEFHKKMLNTGSC